MKIQDLTEMVNLPAMMITRDTWNLACKQAKKNLNRVVPGSLRSNLFQIHFLERSLTRHSISLLYAMFKTIQNLLQLVVAWLQRLQCWTFMVMGSV